MKNSNPVSPVILEGGVETIALTSNLLTVTLNPESSNYVVTSLSGGNKTITLSRPVSNEATRRLIAKNGCMVTFYGKTITSGTVTINFESESYTDVTSASVTSHTLTTGEYITFVFVRDTWRLMSEISPSSLSSVSTLSITGNSANSLALSSQNGGITVSGNNGTINLSGTSSQLKFTNTANHGYAIEMADGAGASIKLTQGNFETAGGNFTSTDGYFYAQNGYIQSGKGFVNLGSYRDIIQNSDILSFNGNNTATGFNAKTKLIVVTGSSTAAVTITLPDLATVLSSSQTAVGGESNLSQYTTFYFSIVNNVPANGTVTIGGPQDKVGPMAVSANHSGMFAYRFTDAPTTGAATVYRVA